MNRTILVCGTPEHEQAEGADPCKWPQLPAVVKYFEALAFAGLTRDQVAKAYDTACQQWAAVAGVSFLRLATPDGANLVAGNGAVDGPYGVLAYSELPCGVGPLAVLSQTYDNAEPWSIEGLSMLIGCMCHEIGHALGLQHMPGTGALMEPFIVAGRSTPQAPDIKAIQALYGVPATSPPFVPGPTNADFVALGRSFAPYILGPFADALVVAARQMDGGAADDAAAALGANYEEQLRSQAWETLIVPKLSAVPRSETTAALRSLAKGLASAVAVSAAPAPVGAH